MCFFLIRMTSHMCILYSSGRCSKLPGTDTYRGGDRMRYSHGYCPVDYSWLAVGGLMLFVLAFAPGRSNTEPLHRHSRICLLVITYRGHVIFTFCHTVVFPKYVRRQNLVQSPQVDQTLRFPANTVRPAYWLFSIEVT